MGSKSIQRVRPFHKSLLGFSLAEVLLAIGLLAIALLALIGQSTLLAKSSQKVDDSSVAYDVAQSVVERLAQEALLDQPAGRNLLAWQHDSEIEPYLDGSETIGFTEYTWEVYVTNITSDVSGETLGTGPTGAENENTRLKLFRVKVEWWGGEAQENRIKGVGKLRVETSRLMKVTRVI